MSGILPRSISETQTVYNLSVQQEVYVLSKWNTVLVEVARIDTLTQFIELIADLNSQTQNLTPVF